MEILITSIVDLRKSAHNRLHQFIKYLSKRHNITVISVNDCWKGEQADVKCHDESFDRILQNVNISYLTNQKISPYWQEAFSIASINKVLDKDSYDVHFNYNTLISGLIIANKLKSEKVSTVYDIADNLPEMIRTSPQVPTLLRPLGGVVGDIALSKNIKIASKVTVVTKFLEGISRVPENKSSIIPNGVDTKLFKNCASTKMEGILGIDHSFTLGYVGVLREWVDLEPVFAALRNLNKPDIKVLIVGKEGEFNKTRYLVKRYGIEKNVVFTGAVSYEDVPKYISCMDVCLVPFLSNKVTEDPCPLKLFEYLACEKPVISTVYTSAVKKRILYASTVDEYQKVILDLYRNEDLRQQFGKAGRSFVMKFYDWSKISSDMETTLTSVVL
jgi:glycosyltransferase involved in cell wall biosynthesis